MHDGVWVPKKLTAENGVKKALIGEFEEFIIMECDGCDGSGLINDEVCDECHGAGDYSLHVPVGWSTIKAIWEKAIDTVGIDAVDVYQVAQQALFFVRSVQTLNRTRYHQVYPHGYDEDPCYWQTQEWVNWIMELSRQLEQSLSELIKQKNSSMIQTKDTTGRKTGE